METTDGAPEPNDLVLTIPSEARYVGLARLFAASAARAQGIDEETIDDIKIVISEAATGVVQDGYTGAISVAATRMNGALTYAVHRSGRVPDDGSQEPAPTSDLDGVQDVRLQIIRALFPGAHVDQADEDRTTLRFSVDVPA